MLVKEIYGKMVNIDILSNIFPWQAEIVDMDALFPGC